MEHSRICIVTSRNIFDSPCLDKFRAVIQEPFDIIYWDRRGMEESCGAANHFKFTGVLAPDAGKKQKLGVYFRFLLFANRILRTCRYEKLIVYPTQMAWLIAPQLLGAYKGKYVLDIRDYAGENRTWIARLTGALVNAAGMCSITSPAYRTFLPERDYVISHNVQQIDPAQVQAYRSRIYTEEQPIVLSFIGSVRFIPQQKKLIRLFANDVRFQLRFIGSGSEQLAEFCREQDIRNVVLIGRFERHQLAEFYMDTDLAINIYGNHDPYLDYALSNKLYSAAAMGMPILVSPGTYMAEIVEEYRIGFPVDLDDSAAPDRVYEYYTSIDTGNLQQNCDAFLQKVSKEESIYYRALALFLEQPAPADVQSK